MKQLVKLDDGRTIVVETTTDMVSVDDHKKRLREVSRAAKQAVRDFVEGIKASDVGLLARSIPQLEYGLYDGGGWHRAFVAASKLRAVPRKSQNIFLRVYLEHGDHIRQECRNDFAIADGLRKLLPRYTGRGRRLYRGEGFRNRRRRTYGLSWTASREVALGFADGIWRTTEGGSVILETDAPKDAIICAPGCFDNSYGEQEYLVDRRLLGRVKVLQRLEQISPEEWARRSKEDGEID